jgi:hypothetical protein
MPITFTVEDIKLTYFPHTYAMVINAHIDKWDATHILVDNGSQAEILFLSAFNQMGYDRRQLKEATKPLYDFGGRRIEPATTRTLPVSFGNPQNARIEYITFNVVDMHYPYNAIFGRGPLNIFEATLHSAYLCLKVPAPLGVISIFGSQKDARNIEKGFTPGHKNMHFLREEQDNNQDAQPIEAEAKNAIEVDCETKCVPLDHRVPNKIILIKKELSSKEET